MSSRGSGQTIREHFSQRQYRSGQRVESGLRAMGIDVWEVIEAAKTKPFGFMAFYPGPDLAAIAFRSILFILPGKRASTGEIHDLSSSRAKSTRAMPEYVVRRVADALNERKKAVRGSRILILGIAYKPT